MMRVARRAINTASPKYELSLPPRPLVPMEAVKRSPTETVFSVVSSNETDSSADSRGVSPYAPTQICPHVYLGGQDNAQSMTDLRDFRIQKVLNVAEECEDSEELLKAMGIEVKHVYLRDHSDEPISHYFDDCLQYIREGVLLQQNVLVHCRFGVSRSATIIIAYLMKFGVDPQNPRCLTYEEAFDYVKERRPLVSPNLGFVLALKALEASCRQNQNQGCDGSPAVPLPEAAAA